MRHIFEPLSVLVQDAERPVFQGQAGRKPFAAPQIRSFSRGSGLLLPTTDVHQPEVHSQSLYWSLFVAGLGFQAASRMLSRDPGTVADSFEEFITFLSM
jgi:hypothetical protein